MSAAERFVEAYLRAWRTNDPDDVRAAFAPGCTYEAYPHDPDPAIGIAAILALWQEAADPPDVWDFAWTIEIETPESALVRAVTTYHSGPKEGVFDNLWIVHLTDDGRATSFHDFWVQRPETIADTHPVTE
jgi:ketosteroid isomerase-like protein